MTRPNVWILSALLALACTYTAIGQCPFQWRPGQGFPGINGPVYATTSWDPDGPGPQPALLIAAGSFTIAGESEALNIAAWNGATWQPLGGGLGGDPSPIVYALTVYNGDLIAGGSFTTAGGANIRAVARWNGTAWSAFSGGTGVSIYGVFALTVFNGDLVAAGLFANAGGNYPDGVFRWNGTDWQLLGTGADHNVFSLTVYNGELIAGGWFGTIGGVNAHHIARWNDFIWQPLGAGMDYNGVLAMTVYNGDLIAGGVFNQAGESPANHIARWNGFEWAPLGTGLETSPGDEGAPISALTVFNGALIAGGSFTSAGGTSANRIARWDGTTWQALDEGVNAHYFGVLTLTEFDGDLIAGGHFHSAGKAGAANIARWTSTSWQPMGTGTNGPVQAFTVSNGDLIAGGSFSIAGGVIAQGAARWNGSTFQPLGSGFYGAQAVTEYNDQIVAAGYSRIARFDGSHWQTIGMLGGGEPYDVHSACALATYDGQLVAAGAFSMIDGEAVYHIARWDGADWAPLGSGISGTNISGPPVAALTIYNGELIAAGDFFAAGGVSMNAIARWNGLTWQTLGSGLNNRVNALAIYNGELIAAGWFTSAGGINANRIARWNGTTWQPLGNGVNDGVTALKVYNGELIVGGVFTVAGNQNASGIARWNGTSWQSLGAGISVGTHGPSVHALAEYQGDLIIGGGFLTVGGEMSLYFARWGPACRGDMNCDNTVNTVDVPYFIEALLATGILAGCDVNRADMNQDGSIDGRDAKPFVDALIMP